ncbi:hypothetical protein [Cohnella sp. 56]|uniref:hypothetical protein n=1 Tax=Cohnella sp. 56 TaxID=3113722 RepID=UPI0030E8C0BB
MPCCAWRGLWRMALRLDAVLRLALPMADGAAPDAVLRLALPMADGAAPDAVLRSALPMADGAAPA